MDLHGLSQNSSVSAEGKSITSLIANKNVLNVLNSQTVFKYFNDQDIVIKTQNLLLSKNINRPSSELDSCHLCRDGKQNCQNALILLKKLK